MSTWWLAPGGIVVVLWLGLATTTVAYLLFGVGLKVLQPGHIATLTLLEPAIATVLGVVVLGEPVAAVGWIGCLLVFGALALLGIAENRREEPNVEQGAVT
jgi:DME family drug/metabolite transporter